MKDIQEEMAWAIERSIYIDGPVMQQCLNEASFECAEIADQQSVNFIHWINEKGYHLRIDGLWVVFEFNKDGTNYVIVAETTAQLLQRFKEESK
jgi:hypothetical protein